MHHLHQKDEQVGAYKESIYTSEIGFNAEPQIAHQRHQEEAHQKEAQHQEARTNKAPHQDKEAQLRHQDPQDGHLGNREHYQRVHQCQKLHRLLHHSQEVARNTQNKVIKKIGYIYYFLLDIYSIIFRILVINIFNKITVAFEVSIGRRTPKSTIRIYLYNIYVFVLFMGVLPTVVSHPSLRAHQHLQSISSKSTSSSAMQSTPHASMQPTFSARVTLSSTASSQSISASRGIGEESSLM